MKKHVLLAKSLMVFAVTGMVSLLTSTSFAQGGDDCASAEPVLAGTHTFGTIVGGGYDATCLGGATGGKWFTYTATDDGVVTVKSCGGVDTRVSVFSGSCGSFTCLGSNDDDGDTACHPSGFASSVSNIAVTNGQTIYIQWDNRWSTAGSSWSITLSPPPPPGSCIHPFLWSSTNAPATPTPQTVTTCMFAGYYWQLNNAVAGNEYEFDDSFGNYVTITDAANDVLAFGTMPLTWTSTITGNIRIHLSTNSSCGTDSNCNDLIVTCTSCVMPPPGPCIQPFQFGNLNIPATNTPITQNGTWAGEYVTFNGITMGSDYSFSSSTGSDWLTLTDELNNPLAFGTTPLLWTADMTGTVRVHVSLDASCATQNSGRNITGQCTSCPAPPPGSCIHPFLWSSSNAPSTPTPQTLTTCMFAGYYWQLNNVALGNEYEFDDSFGNYVTITDDLDNVLDFGTLPLTWTSTLAGNIRIHLSTSDLCGTDANCNDLFVTCTSCVMPPPGPCIQPFSFGNNNIPVNGNPITVFGIWAGEYTVFNNVTAGETYTFTSSNGSDWLTLTDATNTVLDDTYGTTPLNWVASISGTVRVHVSSDAACSTQNTGRDITAQCTTCTPPPPGPGDNCSMTLPIACGDAVSGTTVGRPTDAVDFCGTTNGTGGKVWYEFAGNGDIITASLCGSSYDTKIWVFEGLCNALNCVTGNDDFCGLQSEVQFNSVSGLTYYIVVGGFGAGEGSYTLNLSCLTPPPPPACADNVTITPTPGCDNYDITLAWDATPTATGYNVYAGTAPGLYDIANPFDAGNFTEVFLQNPVLNTNYYFLVVPYNEGGEAVGCSNEVNILTGNNACACIPQYTSGKTSGDLISNVEIPGTTLANNTGTAQVNPAFTYFTGQPNYTADLVQGGSYNVTISIGTWGDQGLRAWIDYNDDNVFDNSESIGFTTIAPGGGFNAGGFPPAIFPVNLDYNAPLGTHRMRIRCSWITEPSTLDPCATYTFGEAEDYDITIVPPVTTQLQPNFCNITGVTMDMPIRATNVFAPQYRFRIVGANNGGQGWNANTYILDRNSRDMKFAFVPGSLWGTTYTIDVAVGDGFGNYGPYGATCTVALMAEIPTTQLVAANCNSINVDPSVNLLAMNITSASGYRFQVNGPGVAPNTTVTKTMGGGAMRKLKMNEVAGIQPGETYTVEVAIRDAAGNWGAYGTACDVTLMGAPDMVINNDIEMIQTRDLTAIEFGVSASHNPFTTEFGLQVLNANDTEMINVAIYDMSGKLIERHAINPMDIEAAQFGSNLASGMYMVEVKQGTNQALVRQIKN